jgi:hypothetical protein
MLQAHTYTHIPLLGAQSAAPQLPPVPCLAANQQERWRDDAAGVCAKHFGERLHLSVCLSVWVYLHLPACIFLGLPMPVSVCLYLDQPLPTSALLCLVTIVYGNGDKRKHSLRPS